LPRFSPAPCSLAGVLSLLCTCTAATTLAGWSQYGANGIVEARLVTDEPVCPDLIADGASLPMSERAPPSPAFPVRVCIAAIPAAAQHVSAGGLDLPVPIAKPRHIVLFGDSGCRMKVAVVQDCSDENSWPFRKVADHAAMEHPDLMIHLGDYLYRESPCQPGDSRCAGSPWGDNWATWNADFFTPAAKLLTSTVWLVARGNHEDCSRAGIGWTTLLGHDPLLPSCNPHESPLLIDLDGVKLAVLDDNDADDKKADRAVAKVLRRDVRAAMTAKANWLVTHHPFRGISKADQRRGGKIMEGANATLLTALAGIDEAPLTLMLAGHIHNFQIENYAGSAAPQLVVGEGGDDLDTVVPPLLTGLVTGGKTVTQGLSLPGFGYVMIDRVGKSRDWKITVHAADGAVLRRCALEARKLTCDPAGTATPTRAAGIRDARANRPRPAPKSTAKRSPAAVPPEG
jgi:predicted phosphodiesterase